MVRTRALASGICVCVCVYRRGDVEGGNGKRGEWEGEEWEGEEGGRDYVCSKITITSTYIQ